MKHLCVTLLLLCNAPNFESDKKIFIEKIKSCAIQYNSYLPIQERIPVVLVVAQSIQESNWGKSRFAKEANNFFGIRALTGENYILALRSNKKVKKYLNMCESVEDYINLLLTGKHYKNFRKELINQWVKDDIDVNKLVDTLDLYAEDVYYKNRIKKIILSIERIIYDR